MNGPRTTLRVLPPRCGSARPGTLFARRASAIVVCAVVGGVVAQSAQTADMRTQGRLQQAAYAVFGSRAPTALCIAHYESTDGRYLYNGSNLGPWQVNVAVHRWVDARRVVTDFYYAAQVAYRISGGGRNWRPWSTHRLCGV